MENFIPVIDSLIENIPIPKYTNINLILDGGAFNGSYHHGVLMYHKQLEKQKYIVVNNISGTSIGSICGLLYIIDKLELGINGFNIMRNGFKNTGTLRSAEIWLKCLFKSFPVDTYKLCNGRLYITYFDLIKCKECVISNYKNNNHIMKSINKSMFIPYLLNGTLAYKNKYIDGFYPHMFKENINIKNVYINLQSIYKFTEILKISHDKNSYRRILDAINDTHTFYLLNKPTVLCSYVEEWTYIDKQMYNMRVCGGIIVQYYTVIHRAIIFNIPDKYRTIIIKLKLYNLLVQLSYNNYMTIVNDFLIN